MIIIAEKYGQLGNRLFLFAHVIACAREHGIKVSDPAFDEYADFFESTKRDLFCRFPARQSLFKTNWVRRFLYRLVRRLTYTLCHRLPHNRFWQVIRIAQNEDFDLGDASFVEAARRKLVFVQGWKFRDEPSLRKHAQTIREFFLPVEPLRRTVASHLERARAGNEILVGVHIRQGDYKHFESGKYFYESAAYARMMNQVEGLFPGRRVGFLICSNAPQSSEAFAGFKCTSGPGHFVEDMYALAACDYILGPPSTFTMWASFYGGAPLYSVTNVAAEVTFESFKLAAVDLRGPHGHA